mmetsp:Transcript_6340/g.14671  ORF Transcript_6340/g.14671 Transcript_6340/m.14671 type:complete len:97 (-) Transcript_6340:168-458(-)
MPQLEGQQLCKGALLHAPPCLKLSFTPPRRFPQELRILARPQLAPSCPAVQLSSCYPLAWPGNKVQGGQKKVNEVSRSRIRSMCLHVMFTDSVPSA